MRGHKKLSPSERIMRYIEGERYDISLLLQDAMAEGADVNSDFILGYCAALDNILLYASAVFKQS